MAPLRPSARISIQIDFATMPDGSATAHIYRPKIVTVLAEEYNLDCLRRDMLAALTVAIVALPLSMAIAVASGVSPERGLYAAVIGGFWYQRWAAAAIRSAVPPVRSSYLSQQPPPNSAWKGCCLPFSSPDSY